MAAYRAAHGPLRCLSSPARAPPGGRPP
jgi:hypothetical protein